MATGEGTLSVLVVDDEPLARERLRSLVLRMSGLTLAGTAETAEQALALMQQSPVDVLLLDIHMPGLGGLGLARELGAQPQPPSIVFVTAHAEHGAQAFELDAADYLVKPVRAERLEAALQRVRQHRAGRASTGADGSRTHLHARLRGGLRRIPIERVLYLVADEKYVSVRHDEGEALLEESLKSIEEAFPGRFLRIHRNCLVQPGRVESLDRDGEGRHWIRLGGIETPLEVSRRNVAQVRDALAR